MNIYDIAKEAGVSISTVSRVLNDKGYVSEKTKARIQEVLKKNKYQPSAIARGLVSGTMKNVAIVTVDVRHPHYAMTTFYHGAEADGAWLHGSGLQYRFQKRRMYEIYPDAFEKSG